MGSQTTLLECGAFAPLFFFSVKEKNKSGAKAPALQNDRGRAGWVAHFSPL
jgi:hypothetical protein